MPRYEQFTVQIPRTNFRWFHLFQFPFYFNVRFSNFSTFSQLMISLINAIQGPSEADLPPGAEEGRTVPVPSGGFNVSANCFLLLLIFLVPDAYCTVHLLGTEARAPRLCQTSGLSAGTLTWLGRSLCSLCCWCSL